MARLNLEGDGQANLSVHGGPDKAVYTYSWENVEWWQKTLDREDLRPGSFGENLTVEGLLDGDVPIGDELAVGTARFLMTQPRLPCYTLGIALAQPDFPKLFQRSGRNGFYLRVLKEGAVAAGDAIRTFPYRKGERVTIQTLLRIVTEETATPTDLQRLVKLEALPEGWKSRLRRRIQESLK